MKFRNINVRNLRGLRVLRGEIVFSIRQVKNDTSENLRMPRKLSNTAIRRARRLRIKNFRTLRVLRELRGETGFRRSLIGHREICAKGVNHEQTGTRGSRTSPP